MTRDKLSYFRYIMKRSISLEKNYHYRKCEKKGKTTSIKMDGLNYRSSMYIFRRPEGSGWGYLNLEKFSLFFSLRVDIHLIIHNS